MLISQRKAVFLACDKIGVDTTLAVLHEEANLILKENGGKPISVAVQCSQFRSMYKKAKESPVVSEVQIEYNDEITVRQLCLVQGLLNAGKFSSLQQLSDTVVQLQKFQKAA